MSKWFEDFYYSIRADFFLYREMDVFSNIFVIKEEKYIAAKQLKQDFGKQEIDLFLVLYRKDRPVEAFALLKFYKNLNIKYIMGFDDSLGVYDISFDYINSALHNTKGDHFTKRFCYILDALGIKNYELSYHMKVADSYRQEMSLFLSDFQQKKIVCLNPFSSTEFRDFSLEQTVDLLRYLAVKKNIVTILVGTAQQKEQLKKILLPDNSLILPFDDFFDVAALVQLADLVITPDTAMVHLANIYNKKMICVYNNRKLDYGEQNNVVWGPNYSNAVQIFTKDNLGTTDGDYIRDFCVEEMYPYIDEILG